MRPADLSPRAIPSIRRLVLVVLAAVLALVTARSALLGDAAAEPAGSGASGPAAVTVEVDQHAGEGLAVVLPAGRRTSELEALVAAPTPVPAVSPAAAPPTRASVADEPVPGGLVPAPLGSRAPPARLITGDVRRPSERRGTDRSRAPPVVPAPPVRGAPR